MGTGAGIGFTAGPGKRSLSLEGPYFSLLQDRVEKAVEHFTTIRWPLLQGGRASIQFLVEGKVST